METARQENNQGLKTTETLLENDNVKKMLSVGVRTFNQIVNEANVENADENIDNTVDNLILMDEAITRLDEFSPWKIREEVKKNESYHVNICPKADLREKDGKLMMDFSHGPVKEVQIKISGVFEDLISQTPDRVMARTGYDIEYYISEANFERDEKRNENKVRFTKQDGIKLHLRNDGLCTLQGRKYAGDLGYTADKPVRIDTLPNMAPTIKAVQNQIDSMKLF
jgi:hypothetical protein